MIHLSSRLWYNNFVMTLYETLEKYTSTDVYPFHMPGHKRRAAHMCDPAAIDITEIDGFDNLHHACGILREAEERAASLYSSSETHFLVNGSTCGVLAAIGACTSPGGHILMARNSHRSAFNAVWLNRLRCSYLYPAVPEARSAYCTARTFLLYSDRNGPVDPLQVEQAFNAHSGIQAVFLTSPAYDGVVSDIRKIAEIAHRHGTPLIVDEAHGAHFGMHSIFPESSVKLGADLVIHSLHKTLPALTQTALIHVNGDLVDRGRLRQMLSVYQTSSPSYVLMASIDRCIRLLADEGPDLFSAYAQRLENFYAGTQLKHLSFLKTDDPSRILISPKAVKISGDISGAELYHILRERFHLQPEMAAPSYVLMLSSVCDDDEGFARLRDALLTLDHEYGGSEDVRSVSGDGSMAARSVSDDDSEARHTAASSEKNASDASLQPDICCTISEALDSASRPVPFAEAEGSVCAEFLTMYPPGVPLLVPGERIRAGSIRTALKLREQGYSLQGPEDYSLRQIKVLCRR